MRILYLHGLGSGANSRTVKCLQKAFPDAVIDRSACSLTHLMMEVTAECESKKEKRKGRQND